MNKYELGVIVRADLGEERITEELDRVKGFIERFGGTIEKVDDWGRRKLAYPIEKQTEGFYSFISYDSPSDTPALIEDRLRLQENVLRFLTIFKDPREIAANAAAAERAAELMRRAQAAREAARAAAAAAAQTEAAPVASEPEKDAREPDASEQDPQDPSPQPTDDV